MNETLKLFKYEQVVDFYDEIALEDKLNNELLQGLGSILKNMNA